MALMELTLSHRSKSEVAARPFDCSSCPVKIQKLRRCREDRWDFTAEDNPAVFPISVKNGGASYGFCPAKSTWDLQTRQTFNILRISAETGQLFKSGGLVNQPEWFIELLADFLPLYDKLKFIGKAQMILGDGEKTKSNIVPTTSKGRQVKKR